MRAAIVSSSVLANSPSWVAGYFLEAVDLSQEATYVTHTREQLARAQVMYENAMRDYQAAVQRSAQLIASGDIKPVTDASPRRLERDPTRHYVHY